MIILSPHVHVVLSWIVLGFILFLLLGMAMALYDLAKKKEVAKAKKGFWEVALGVIAILVVSYFIKEMGFMWDDLSFLFNEALKVWPWFLLIPFLLAMDFSFSRINKRQDQIMAELQEIKRRLPEPTLTPMEEFLKNPKI